MTEIAADGIELTDEQRSTRALVRELVDNEVAPHAAAWDRESHFPRELFAKLGELDLMGITMPEELGGAGADYLTQTLAVEELARGDAGVGTTVTVHAASTAVLQRNGTEEQQRRWVPRLVRADEIAAFALTEPDAGSDVRSLRAVASGDKVSGMKQWVTNGSFASLVTVFARDDQAEGELSAFVVESHAPGFAVVREEQKMGLHSSSTADIAFDATPGELLGERGKGLKIALSTVGGGRISIAAVATGIAQAAFEMATAYAKERVAFGRQIGAFQAIQGKLADMQTEISAARALTHRAARLRDAGRPHAFEASQAKLFASGVARRQTGEALQILGGVGYTREFPAERYYRDAKITEIYEGTSEIQRLVIAREILGGLVTI